MIRKSGYRFSEKIMLTKDPARGRNFIDANEPEVNRCRGAGLAEKWTPLEISLCGTARYRARRYFMDIKLSLCLIAPRRAPGRSRDFQAAVQPADPTPQTEEAPEGLS